MTHEFFFALCRCTLIASGAVLIVLALRQAICLAFGAQAAYRLWLVVPFAAVATLLPAPVQPLVLALPLFSGDVSNAPLAAVAPVAAFDPQFLLLGVWLCGAFATLVTFMLQQRRYLRRLGRLTGIDAYTLRAENTSHCPALIGAIRPRIVLPGDFESRYAPRERELVLAHERAHLARGDAQINALVAVLRCLQWFNPLFHFAALRFRFDQELACDANVIARFPEARRCYADAMLKAQLAGQARQELRLPVGCHWPSGHPLKERIAMLKRPLPGPAKTVVGLALAAVLVGTGSYAAWAAQPGATKSASSVNVTHASYRRISRIAYPGKTGVAGYCVVVVTLGLDATGAITGLNELTVHGNAPQALCRHWGTRTAAAIMAKPWTFEPATENGKPVASQAIIPLVFTAHSNDFFDSSTIPDGALDAIRISAMAASSSFSQGVAASEQVTYRKTVPPKYPAAAIQAHQQGKIILKVQIDAHGNPVSAKVYKAEPPEVEATFAQTSIDAVMKWKFNPAENDGKKVSGDVLVPFTYSLTEL
jgi:TonB family protein